MKQVRYILGVTTYVTALIHFISMILLAIFTEYFGGAADPGKIEAGKYFLNTKGGFVEVAKNVYVFSRWHMIILLINFFFLCVVGITYWGMGGFRGKSNIPSS